MTDDTQPEPREIMTPLVAAGVDVHGMPLKGCCDNWPECSHVYYAVAAHDAALAASAPSEPSDDSPLNLGCGCPWEENGAATVRHTYHKPDCKWLGSLGVKEPAPPSSTHTERDRLVAEADTVLTRVGALDQARTVRALVAALRTAEARAALAEKERDDARVCLGVAVSFITTIRGDDVSAPPDSTHTAADTVRKALGAWVPLHGAKYPTARDREALAALDSLVAALRHAEQERDDMRRALEWICSEFGSVDEGVLDVARAVLAGPPDPPPKCTCVAKEERVFCPEPCAGRGAADTGADE